MRIASLALCLALSSLCQAAAQAPTQGEPEVVSHEAPAIFSSRVNLVSVPVVIRDKDGHAVGGLKQKDFELFDKGKSQVITKFSIQTSTPAPVTVSTSSSVSTSTAAPTEAASKPELPDRYVAYFFDDVHMQPGDLLQARQAANHHLDTVLDPEARAGIFTTSGRTTQDFTNDLAKLHDAVNRIQPWTVVQDKGDCLQISYFMADYLINQEVSLTPFGINPSSTLAHAMIDEAAGCVVNTSAGSTQTDPAQLANLALPTAGNYPPLRYLWQVANTALQHGAEETSSGLAVLRDLITKMSVAPGSRTIVLVSPGFILTKDHRSGENTILDSAIHAGVIVNSLDIRGVYTPLRTHTFDAEYGGSFGGAKSPESGQARTNVERDEIFQSGNILAELAYGTGGTVHNDNGFEEGLKELAGRPEYVYVLGFSPDNLKNDGSYHGLKVKLKEGAKLDIEARRGYWAPSHAADPAEAAKEELKETLFSRDEIADIPLDLHAEFFKPSGAKAEISVVARLDAKALKFRKAEERNNDTLTVVTGLFDQNGNYISGIERVVEMRLRDQSLEVLERSGISVEQSFSVPPGRYIVRVVVKDSEGHTTAARNTGIEVP
jgi:VWFA-related protein